MFESVWSFLLFFFSHNDPQVKKKKKEKRNKKIKPTQTNEKQKITKQKITKQTMKLYAYCKTSSGVIHVPILYVILY